MSKPDRKTSPIADRWKHMGPSPPAERWKFLDEQDRASDLDRVFRDVSMPSGYDERRKALKKENR